MKKRFLSILLALCMMTQFVPTAALAAQSDAVGNGTTTALVATETEQGSDQGAGDGDNETALYNEAAINAVDETGDGSEPTLASANGTDGSDAAAHTHCVCGGSITAGDHSEHTSATWTAWDGTSDIEYANGVASVYLSDNAARSNVLTVKDGSTLNLCLNGKTLSYSYTVIAVEGNATLNICDCKGGGQVASPSGCAVSVTTKNGSNAHTTLNLYGGKVSSKSYSMVDPGAIKLNNNDANNAQTVAVFNMYGGEVRHEDLNESAVYASYANIGSGYYQINMYGGNITCEKGNGFTSNNNQNVAIQVAGGTITAGWYGIWLSSQNTLTLSGNPKFVDKAYFDSNAGIYIPAEAALSVAGDFIPAEGTTISVTGDAVIARPAAGGSSLSGKAQYFVSSDEGYFVECNEDGNLQLTACAITDQPTADNGYAVAANGGSTDKVAYQWYKATSGKVAVTDKNATATGDFSYFGSSYGNEWYPRYDPESADQVTLEAFTLHMAKDDVLTVKYRNRDYAENNGPGRFDRFTLTGNDGEVEGIWGAEDWDTTYAFTAPADGDYTLKATVTPGTDEDPYDGSIYYNLWCDFSATVTADVAGDALSGQTAAALNTAELENGKYICGVTWEDKTTLYSNAVELSAPVHTHCVCGKTDCSGDGHDATTTWQPWTSDDSLPTGSGNYYLTDDVELSETWICGADVNLCLNGHDIIETGNADAIKVNGKTLAITDCHDGEEVGKITHAENALGRGINNWGNLALWNGNITGNSVVDYAAGVANWGEFTMFGGSVTGNSADEDGGGVYNLDGAFAMFGGSVTGNSAGKDGGGVYNFGFFNLSGSVTITGNTANGADSNVYLPDGDAIAVATSGMGAGASVGVTAEAPGSTPTVVTGSTDATVFFSDDETYGLTENDAGGLKLVLASSLHKHKVCGEESCSGDHGKELTWKAISSLDQIAAEGNYYLTGDVELKSTWECSYNVNLCLNGKTIYGPSGYAAIEVNGGKTLVITDCHDGEDVGKITHAENAGGSGIRNHGTLTLWNGSITENTVTYEGGGVWSHGTFDMHGGFITGNTAKYGGGVYNEIGSNFTMSGGTISGNTATDHSGGGVCSQGTFNMTGGKIGGNTAKYGGGVYSGATISNTFTMSDTAIITGNSAERGGGAFIDSDSTFAMTGGSISGNSADSGGGVTNWGAVNLSGDVIIEGNAANDTDNNVYVGCDSENNRIFSVSVTGTMGDNASVGITVENPDSTPVVVTGTNSFAGFSSDDTNYELLPNGESSLKLSAKPVTISGVKLLVSDGGSVMTEDQSKVYDGLAVAYDASKVAVEPSTVTGWELSYTWQKATVTDGVSTYTDLAAAPSDAGSYRLLVTAKRGEVELGTCELPFTITQREVTISGLSASKTYDGDATAEKAEITGTAIVGNKVAEADDVSLNTENMRGTFNSADADKATTVTLSELSLTGSASANYRLPETVTCAGSITKASGSGSVTLDGWTYGEAAKTPKPTSETNGTDNVTYKYKVKDADDGTYSGTVPSDAGDYTVKATFAATGNYEAVDATTDFTIAKAGTMTVSGTDYSAAYDGKSHGEAAVPSVAEGTKVEYSTDGGATWSQTAPTVKDVAEVTVKVRATNQNYKQAETSYTLKVTQRPVTLASEGKEFTYNGQAQKWEHAGVASGSFADGEGVASYAFDKSVTNVGDSEDNTFSYELSAATKASNYRISQVAGKLTVSSKSIVPDPDDPANTMAVDEPSDSVYDGAEHKWAPTVKDGETVLAEGTDYELSYSTGNFTDVTGYITVTVKGKGNYSGSFAKQYQVTQRPVTFTGNSDTKTYNGSEQTVDGYTANNGEGTGLVSGQTTNVEASASGLLPGTTTGTITAAKDVVIKSGEADVTGNYSITTEPGSMTINKVEGTIVVTAASDSKTYDGTALTNKGFTYTEGVLVGGDVLTAVVEGSATDVGDEGVNAVASCKVMRGDTDVTSAYTFGESVAGKLAINPRGYTVVTDSASKVYDGEALTAGGKIEGIVDGEDAGFQVTGGQTEVGESKNTYEVKWDAGAKESNYEFLGETVGTLTVTAQSIDPGADPESPDPAYKGVQVGQPSDVEYNGQAQEQKPTVTDKDGNPLFEGVDYEISFSKDTVNVGEVTVTIKGTGNYAGTVERTYQITAKPLAIDHLVIAEKYYDGTNEASFIAKPVLVGVVSGDEVTLVNGVPIFTSIAVGRDIPISFTEFTLDGADAGNYALTQPSGITGDISAYNAFGTEYATTTTDWTNQAFVVTASSGWLVSETNTAEGTWSESLTRSAETGSAGDRLTFYVKSKDHGFISEAITKTYMIDKTVPSIKGARDGKTYCGAVVLTVTDANLDKVTVNGKVVEPTADEAMALAADAPAEFMFTVQPAEGEQTVVATDKAGNSTTLKLTVNDGHTWGAWTSNGNGTHTHACEYDDSTETADCHGGTATCIDRAVCDDCGQPYGEVDSSNHAALTHVEAKAATATAEGNIEYWYCEACGRHFADEAGAKEIQQAETVVAKKAEAPDGNKGGKTDGKTGGTTDGKTGGSAAGAGSGKSQVPRTGDSTAAAWPPAILGAAALAAMLVSARRRRS